jgi:hypothetical protein
VQVRAFGLGVDPWNDDPAAFTIREGKPLRPEHVKVACHSYFLGQPFRRSQATLTTLSNSMENSLSPAGFAAYRLILVDTVVATLTGLVATPPFHFCACGGFEESGSRKARS